VVSSYSTQPAFAAGDEAETHLKKGLELRRESKDSEALDEFEKAYAITPSPRAQAQIGLAQMALGQFAKAETSLQVALQAKGDKWVTKQHLLLEKTLEELRDKLGSLEIAGQPVGAAVEVDGQDAGKLPCSVRLHAGEVAVRVQAPGYVPILRTTQIAARGVAKEQFSLVKKMTEPEAQVARGDEPQPPLIKAHQAAPPAATESSGGGGLRIAGISAAAAGVVGLGVGAFFGFRAKSLSDEVTSAPTFDPSKEQSGKTATTMQYVFLASGGALLAGGGLLYWLGSGDGEPSRTSASLVPVTTPTSLALAFSMRWP
jgi:serine/threonine-protein kinase